MPFGHDSSRLGPIGAFALTWHAPLGRPVIHLCRRRLKAPAAVPYDQLFHIFSYQASGQVPLCIG